MASGDTLARYRIIVTAPTNFACLAQIYNSGATATAVAYTAAAGGTTIAQPVTIAAGASQTFYLPEQPIEISAKVNGVEMAAGQGIRKTAISNGLIEVTPAVPDIVSAIYNAGNSGTTITLNPANGNHQKVTLTGANSYVDITLGSAPAAGYDFTVDYWQDGTGARAINHVTAVAYENNAWPNLVQTPSVLAARVTYSWDGTTWTVSSPTATFPGIDPANLPGCIIAWEAAFQPLAAGATLSRINNRAAASNSPTSGFNNSPTVVELTTVVRPLILPSGRKYLDFTATNKSMDGFTMSTPIAATPVFTVVGSTRITSTAAADGTGLLSFTRADGANFGLSINGNGNNMFINVNGGYTNYTAPAGTLAATPHVYTLTQNGAVDGIFRADGVAQSGVWRLNIQIDKVYFNASLAGLTNQTNCLQQATLYVFPTKYLPADVLTGVERWAGFLGEAASYV